MKSPLVSICLPNLNTRPFLPDRVASILDQTYPSWELVIVDNYSDDGAWEFFEQLARSEKRVTIAQAPRHGLYANWNNCLARAQGEYVYIATSDDTMAPDCIEKLVRALEENNDCDVAHCPLVYIDVDGKKLEVPRWPSETVFASGLAECAWRRHVRRAPYDGLVHLTGVHAVMSITQLLVRRSLFLKTGLFSTRWGSIGDFHWEMKAGLIANSVHVPDTWASWRLHPAQATASNSIVLPAKAIAIEEMVRDAVETSRPYIARDVLEGLDARWLPWSRQMRGYYTELRCRPAVRQRRLYAMKSLFSGSTDVRAEIIKRLGGGCKWPDRVCGEIRSWLESIQGEPAIRFLLLFAMLCVQTVYSL